MKGDSIPRQANRDKAEQWIGVLLKLPIALVFLQLVM